MSSIIDEGHWLYAAVCVVVLSALMQFAVTSQVYSSYEAVYRPLDAQEVQQAEYARQQAAQTRRDHSLPGAGVAQDEMSMSAYDDFEVPDFVFDRLPLPLVGNYGWWFVSFAPESMVTTLLGIAVLYVPCLILLTAMSSSAGSFSVVFRRDYGPLLTCALMARAAAHLPFAIAAVALRSFGQARDLAIASPAGLGTKTALVVWTLSALYLVF